MQGIFIFFKREFFYSSFHKNTTVAYFLKTFYGFNDSKIAYMLRRNGLRDYSLLYKVGTVHLERLSLYIEKFYLLEIYHKLKKSRSLKKYLKYGFFKGIRMRQGMPLRGQRTRTNAQTVRKRVY